MTWKKVAAEYYELEGHGTKGLWPNFKYYGDVSFDRLQKITRHFGQVIQAVNRDLYIQSQNDKNSATMSG